VPDRGEHNHHQDRQRDQPKRQLAQHHVEDHFAALAHALTHGNRPSADIAVLIVDAPGLADDV